MALLITDSPTPLGRSTSFVRQVAGAESNVSIAMSRLGHTVEFVGRVGSDTFGSVVVDTLRADGVGTEHIVFDDTAPTGLLIRDFHERRATDVAYYRHGSAGANLKPEDLEAISFDGVALMHHTGITPVLSPSASAASQRAVELARDAGVLVSFDPNLRRQLCDETLAAELLRPLAASADIVLASQDEAELLSGESGDGAAEWFLQHTPGVVVLKRGAHGVFATNGTEQFTTSALPVPTVDAIGAGDAFDAGFLSATLRGQPIQAALTVGAAVAAACVEVRGDTDGLPTTQELELILAGTTEAQR